MKTTTKAVIFVSFDFRLHHSFEKQKTTNIKALSYLPTPPAFVFRKHEDDSSMPSSLCFFLFSLHHFFEK
jgi:hypothetical protein